MLEFLKYVPIEFDDTWEKEYKFEWIIKYNKLLNQSFTKADVVKFANHPCKSFKKYQGAATLQRKDEHFSKTRYQQAARNLAALYCARIKQSFDSLVGEFNKLNEIYPDDLKRLDEIEATLFDAIIFENEVMQNGNYGQSKLVFSTKNKESCQKEFEKIKRDLFNRCFETLKNDKTALQRYFTNLKDEETVLNENCKKTENNLNQITKNISQQKFSLGEKIAILNKRLQLEKSHLNGAPPLPPPLPPMRTVQNVDLKNSTHKTPDGVTTTILITPDELQTTFMKLKKTLTTPDSAKEKISEDRSPSFVNKVFSKNNIAQLGEAVLVISASDKQAVTEKDGITSILINLRELVIKIENKIEVISILKEREKNLKELLELSLNENAKLKELDEQLKEKIATIDKKQKGNDESMIDNEIVAPEETFITTPTSSASLEISSSVPIPPPPPVFLPKPTESKIKLKTRNEQNSSLKEMLQEIPALTKPKTTTNKVALVDLNYDLKEALLKRRIAQNNDKDEEEDEIDSPKQKEDTVLENADSLNVYEKLHFIIKKCMQQTQHLHEEIAHVFENIIKKVEEERKLVQKLANLIKNQKENYSNIRLRYREIVKELINTEFVPVQPKSEPEIIHSKLETEPNIEPEQTPEIEPKIQIDATEIISEENVVISESAIEINDLTKESVLENVSVTEVTNVTTQDPMLEFINNHDELKKIFSFYVEHKKFMDLTDEALFESLNNVDNKDILSTFVIRDIIEFYNYTKQKIDASEHLLNKKEIPTYQNGLITFYKEALKIRLSNLDIRTQHTLILDNAKKYFTHRHSGRRLCADILMSLSCFVGIGFLIAGGRLALGYGLFFSCASTQRQKDLTKLTMFNEPTNDQGEEELLHSSFGGQ